MRLGQVVCWLVCWGWEQTHCSLIGGGRDSSNPPPSCCRREGSARQWRLSRVSPKNGGTSVWSCRLQIAGGLWDDEWAWEQLTNMGLQALLLFVGLILIGDSVAQDGPLVSCDAIFLLFLHGNSQRIILYFSDGTPSYYAFLTWKWKNHTVQFPESSVRTVRAVSGNMDTTGQIVMQTRVETKSFNDSHTFRVSKSVEFFLKFEVPEKQIAALEADPERHIFQVKIVIEFFIPLFDIYLCNFRSMWKVLKQMKSFLLTSPFVNSGKFGVILKSDWYMEPFTFWNFRQMKTFQLPSVEREGNRFIKKNENKQKRGMYVFFRVVYNSNERSVDFCPIADIDSNSTVLVSISTSSPSSIPVSLLFN